MNIVQRDGMQWLEYYLENSPAVFFIWRNEPDWPVEYVTANVISVFGYTPEDFIKTDITYGQIIHEEDRDRVAQEVIAIEATGNNELTLKPYRIVRKDGEIRWVSEFTRIKRNVYGVVEFYNGYIIDISEQELSKQNLSDSLQKLKKQSKLTEEYFNALDQSYILSMSDPSGRITYVNDNLCNICGYSREELIGKPHSLLRHPDVSKETFRELWATIQAKGVWHGQIQNRAKNGDSYFVQMTIVPILDDEGNIEQYIAIRYDITEQIRQQEHINMMALTSMMTGLPNLYSLVKDIESADTPNLGIVNIDGFKVLNNLYGYKTGDLIIRSIGGLLSSELGSEKLKVYHIHADEFGVLGDGCEFEVFMDKLASFQNDVHINGFTILNKLVPIHVSIACSNEPKERLLSSCNMAIHFARTNHEKFVRYSENVNFSKDYEENLKWTMMLHEAIEGDMIQPYFQPIYDIFGKKIQKYEALIRIIHNGEVHAPYRFLDVAKKVKLYNDISMIMLEKCFQTIVSEPYSFSINLTVEDVMNRRYTDRLFELLQQERKGKVILEIVESEGIENNEAMNQFIEKAKALGCKIAIDDFGTGYSNFEYLLKLNADFIKIDGSLIRNIDTDFDSEIIVRTITMFAKFKKIPVIAEFVHNQSVLDKISEIGIEFAQGYHIGAPSAHLLKKIAEM